MGLAGRPVFQYGTEDDQQFPHAGHKRDFLGLADGAEPLIEIPNHRIEAGRHGCAYVEGHQYLGASTPHRASASQGPTITIQWRDADEGCDLYVRQRAQFWKIGQQGCGQYRANARDSPQPLVFLQPDWTLLNGHRQVGVSLVQRPFEPSDMGLKILADRRTSAC